MKIGIITSGNDTLALFKFLNRYDNEYIIYYDFINRPYGDKTFEYSLKQIKKGIGFLTKQGCDQIILPPIYELAIIQGLMTTDQGLILPLFQSYIHEFCFKYSLIGKLGLVGDFADIQIAQKLFAKEEKNYKLTSSQKNIRKFNFPFKYRSKDTPLRKYYLNNLSYSDFMVNSIIKHDLRYFKDAMVDTLIPLNYGYFNYQNTISKFLNFKKIRFHKLDKLEESFNRLPLSINRSTKYSVSIFYTGHIEFLLREKRLIRLLARGKSTEIQFKEIK